MLSALLFLSAEALPKNCPSTGSWLGAASAYMTIKFTQSCSDVEQEISARGSMENGWHDPHNGGTYSVTSGANSNDIKLQRITGGGQYTDKMAFVFQNDGSGCQVFACSHSQSTSYYDYSTNFCNLWDLFCDSSDCNGSICCKPIKYDLTGYQVINGPTCNTSTNCPATSARGSTCLKTSALEESPISPSLERILKKLKAQ